MKIRVGTWNAGGGSGHDKQVADSLAYMRDELVDLLLLCEVGDRKPLLPANGWGLYQPTGQAKEHCAITWRRSLFNLKSAETTLLTAAERVGEAGAGGPMMQTKWLHRVVLPHPESGRTIQAMGLHMVPSVHLKIRRELYERAIARIAVEVEQHWREGIVMLGGDWNTEPQNSLNRPLMERMRLGHDRVNTRMNRMIDYLLLEQRQKGIQCMGTSTYRLAPSDHKLLVATYQLKGGAS
jgi:Endonuclease/Exonuclease/phosphatase family